MLRVVLLNKESIETHNGRTEALVRASCAGSMLVLWKVSELYRVPFLPQNE